MKDLARRDNIFDSLFNDFAPGFFIRPLHGENLPDVNDIKIDVKEDNDAYTVHADIPGVNKDDIDVAVEGAIVTIRAEIKQHDEEKKDNVVLRSERYTGSVSRSFQLPGDVSTQDAQATYDNGVLTLILPKLANPKSTRLNIK